MYTYQGFSKPLIFILDIVISLVLNLLHHLHIVANTEHKGENEEN